MADTGECSTSSSRVLCGRLPSSWSGRHRMYAMMDPEQQAVIEARMVNDLKQACLDLAKAAGELFDRFEEHGLQAAFRADGAAVVVELATSFKEVQGFLLQQAEMNLRGLLRHR